MPIRRIADVAGKIQRAGIGDRVARAGRGSVDRVRGIGNYLPGLSDWDGPAQLHAEAAARYQIISYQRVIRYPERFAQEALGHNSKAVHRAYARRAQVKLPSLESYERQGANGCIIQMPQFDPTTHQVNHGGQKVG
jgi:hypothetical protein